MSTVRSIAWLSVFCILCWFPVPGRCQQPPQQKTGVEETTAVEDLMREHGVLDRLLLIYQEIGWRLAKRKHLPVHALKTATGIIRSFIQDYHEKLEEEYVFSALKKSGRIVPVVDTLQKQHEAGRKTIDRIMELEQGGPETDPAEVIQTMAVFSRMYRPHKAREDTVVFPEFKKILVPSEYKAAGDKFEDKEHQLFGGNGFEKIVAQVEELEKELDIYELSQYTPKPQS
ncbi:MAG: hemerythrin domain-containing protein [Deltaproteobacteria bacterium]